MSTILCQLTLKEIRQRLGLSQGDVAKKLGCTRQSVFYYETGQRNLSLSKAKEAADVYGITLDELFAAWDEGKRQNIKCG